AAQSTGRAGLVPRTGAGSPSRAARRRVVRFVVYGVPWFGTLAGWQDAIGANGPSKALSRRPSTRLSDSGCGSTRRGVDTSRRIQPYGRGVTFPHERPLREERD